MRFNTLLRAERRRYLTNVLLILNVFLLLIVAFVTLFQFKSKEPLDEQWIYSVPEYRDEIELQQHIDRMQNELNQLPEISKNTIRRYTLLKSIPICQYLLENKVSSNEIMEFPIMTIANAKVPFFSMYTVVLLIIIRLLCVLRCASVICSDFQSGTAAWLYCDARQVKKRLHAKQLLVFLAGFVALIFSIILGIVMLAAFPSGAPTYLLNVGGHYLRLTRNSCLFWLAASLILEYIASFLFCCAIALLTRHIYGCFFTVLGVNAAMVILAMATQKEVLGSAIFPALFLFHTDMHLALVVVLLFFRLLIPIFLFFFANQRIKKVDFV